MIQLKKKINRYIGFNEKLQILKMIAEKKDFENWKIKLKAPQFQELRNFLLLQLKNYSTKISQEPFDEEKIKKKMVPVQTYFQSMDCREPLDACFSETCLGSNPACFSNKMRGQIDVILKELYSLMED
ncbi:MAG: hypothetical protein Kow00108_07810 [Calditrichia bacterium]